LGRYVIIIQMHKPMSIIIKINLFLFLPLSLNHITMQYRNSHKRINSSFLFLRKILSKDLFE